MAGLSFDSDGASRFKSISIARRFARLIKRVMGRLDSWLRTGPARVRWLKSEIVRLGEREHVLMQEHGERERLLIENHRECVRVLTEENASLRVRAETH